MRGVVRSSVAIDPTGWRLAEAVAPATAVALALIGGVAAGNEAAGAIAAAGALPVGVAAVSHPLPTVPLGLLLTTTAGMTISTFVGSLAAGHDVLSLLLLAFWGFAAGLLVVLGRAATITGVQAVVAFVVFGRFPGGPLVAFQHASLVLGGGLLQVLAAVFLRSPRAFRPERVAVAAAYARLAELAAGTAYGGPSGEAVATASLVVSRRSDAAPVLRDLVDESRRIRLELQALTAVADQPHVAAVRAAAASWLAALGDRVSRGALGLSEPSADLAAAVSHLRDHRAGAASPAAAPAAAPASAPVPADVRQAFVAARANALLGQLRAADRLADVLAGSRRIRLPQVAGSAVDIVLGGRTLPGRAMGASRRLREAATDPSGSAFRHAVRLAVLLPVALALAHVLPWARGYWVALTAVVVLKPDYAATVQRGVARVVGTGLGVVGGAVLIDLARPRGFGLVIAIGLLAWLSYAVFAASFAVYSLVLTMLVVLLVSTGDPHPLSAVADRGLDTLIGGALALLGYVAWPTREAPALRSASGELLARLADYADVVLGAYVAGVAVDDAAASAAARSSRRARATLEESWERARAEPLRLRADTATAESILGATRRIVIPLHALRSTLADTSAHVPLPALQPLAAAVGSSLRSLATAAATGVAPPARPALRPLLVELAATTDGSSLDERRQALVAAHLDPVVDSVGTLAHVLGAPA